MAGWCCSIQNVRTFSDLPENAQLYVKRMEKLLGVPGKLISFCAFWTYSHSLNFVTVQYIGVGKGRESIIKLF
jgi:Adenylosuccinate synthetase